MRSLSIFLLCLLIVKSNYGQDIANGNFAINAGNNLTAPGCRPTTSYSSFADGTVPNWLASHGSPNFPEGSFNSYLQNNIIIGASFGISAPGFPANGVYLSDGIMGGYNFMPNTTYEVKLYLKIAKLIQGELYVYAASGINRNLVPGYPNANNCQSEIPTAARSQLIGTLSGIDVWHGQSTDISVYTFNVTIPPGTSYDKIWIYPKSFYSATEAMIPFVYIARVQLRRICEPSKTFSSGTILATNYQNSEYIYAGSSFGTSGTAVQTNPGGSTLFRAGQAVELRNDFTASVNGNNTFIAEIERCDNGIISSAPPKGKTINPDMENIISISPNPAKESITIQCMYKNIPAPLNCEIFDLMGRLIKVVKLSQNDLTIDISDLKPAMYLLRVKNETGLIGSAKFTKQ